MQFREGPAFGINRYTPSYRFVGNYTSFVPDVSYPWPVSMLRRIRLIDPGFVPVFSKKFYVSQAGGVLVFSHHGIARYDRSASPDLRLDAAPHPSHGYLARFPFDTRPNVIDLWFEGPIRPGSTRALAGLPSPFVPWGEWVEAMVRESAWALQHRTRAERAAALETTPQEAAIQAEVRSAVAEAALADKEEAPRRKALFESITPFDVRDNEGRWLGEVKDPMPTLLDLHTPAPAPSPAPEGANP